MNPFDLVGLLAVSFVAVKVLAPLVEAIGDRIRGRRPPDADPALAAELDQLRARLAEVEERVDFAERLLGSREQANQLPGGAHR